MIYWRREKIKDIMLMDEEVWISHDVVGLFPTVPVGEVLEVIEQNLNEDSTLKDHTLLSPLTSWIFSD